MQVKPQTPPSAAAAPATGPAKAGKTKILLVDDHPVVRRGLAQLINQEPDLTVCAEVEDAKSASSAVDQHQPAALVVDISLKGSNGIEFVKNIKARYPDLPILMLSMHDETLYAERALRAGARGYIMKDEAFEQVLVAIRQILKGEIFLSEKMKARMLQTMAFGKAKVVTSPIETLTDRELEVFRLIGQGHSTRQIAQDLHLSIRTVEAYREYIKEKLHLKNATELVQHAFAFVHREEAA